MWFIIGLVLFFITLYVHKHTYIKDWYSGDIRRTVTPVWAVILAYIISMIPILNIIAFGIGVIMYIMCCFNNTIAIKSTRITKKLFDFLNKEV